MRQLGIPIAPEKTCGPATTLTFAGIELDPIKCEARLPRDKIEKCVQTIADFLHRKKVTLKELQSLIGLLNFACSVVTPGRAFSRRLIDLTHGVKSPGHYRCAVIPRKICAFGKPSCLLSMVFPFFWTRHGGIRTN